MTNESPSGAQASRWHRQNIALFGVVLAYFAYNALNLWLLEGLRGRFEFLNVGVLIFEPIIFGIWSALGTGVLMTRLPVVVLCLMLVFISPGVYPKSFDDVQRIEFIATLVAGFVIFAATTILFLIARRVTGCRIESQPVNPAGNQAGVHFSMKYLLCVTTLVALAAGMFGGLTFDPDPPSSFFGPEFYIQILAFGSAILFVTSPPITAVPLLILRQRLTRKSMFVPLSIWAAVTLLTVGVCSLFEGGLLEFLEAVLFAQLGSLLAGALATIPLRMVGFRLVRPLSGVRAVPPIT